MTHLLSVLSGCFQGTFRVLSALREWSFYVYYCVIMNLQPQPRRLVLPSLPIQAVPRTRVYTRVHRYYGRTREYSRVLNLSPCGMYTAVLVRPYPVTKFKSTILYHGRVLE